MLCLAVLHALAVHVEPDGEGLRIGDVIARDQPRAHGAEGVAAFALVPFACRARSGNSRSDKSLVVQ